MQCYQHELNIINNFFVITVAYNQPIVKSITERQVNKYGTL